MQTQAFPVNSLILSSQFWPQFKAECLEFPHEVSEALDVNTKAFQTLKGNRTLVCKSHLGFANIDIEIGDKKIKCLPFLQPSTTRSWRLLSGQPKGWPPASRCRSPPCAGRSPSGSHRGCWWRTHQTPSVWWKRRPGLGDMSGITHSLEEDQEDSITASRAYKRDEEPGMF